MKTLRLTDWGPQHLLTDTSCHPASLMTLSLVGTELWLQLPALSCAEGLTEGVTGEPGSGSWDPSSGPTGKGPDLIGDAGARGHLGLCSTAEALRLQARPEPPRPELQPARSRGSARRG